MKIRQVIDGISTGEEWQTQQPEVPGRYLKCLETGQNFKIDERGRVIQWVQS